MTLSTVFSVLFVVYCLVVTCKNYFTMSVSVIMSKYSENRYMY